MLTSPVALTDRRGLVPPTACVISKKNESEVTLTFNCVFKTEGFLDLKLQVSRELLNAFQADFHNRIEEEEKDRGRS